MRDPQDSTGRPIAVGDRVSWRGQIYTIMTIGDRGGRFGSRVITFEEPLHVQDEVPDEIAVDLVEKAAPTEDRERLDHAFERLRADPAHARRSEEAFDSAGVPQGLQLHEVEAILAKEESNTTPIGRCCALGCDRSLEHPAHPFCTEHMKDEQLVRAWMES